MRSLAPLTLMASSRLPRPPRCSPCQQLLGTQQAKPTVSGTSCTWMGTDPIPLLSAGEQLLGPRAAVLAATDSVPLTLGWVPASPRFCRWEPGRGAGARFSPARRAGAAGRLRKSWELSGPGWLPASRRYF